MTVVASLPKRIRFSIVTPTRNAGRYLEQTISSVFSQQGDFDIEHLIVDSQSTDNTCEIANAFQARLGLMNADGRTGRVSLQIISERDSNMYEAINRGFAAATGDIFAWINADDLYLPGAFEQVARVFNGIPEIRWVKGITTYIDEKGERLSPGKCYLYAQDLIQSGIYGREAYFIQQDSVFWRASLWREVGGLDESFRLAGDYDLWIRFAEREPLLSLNFPVSCFRKVRGQLSEDLDAYRLEQRRITRPFTVRGCLLRRFFVFLEPRCPSWLNALIFRVLRPSDPLYVFDVQSGQVRLKKSFNYMV